MYSLQGSAGQALERRVKRGVRVKSDLCQLQIRGDVSSNQAARRRREVFALSVRITHRQLGDAFNHDVTNAPCVEARSDIPENMDLAVPRNRLRARHSGLGGDRAPQPGPQSS
jgi:hypothetical protein